MYYFPKEVMEMGLSLSPGEQMKMNHSNCPAGTDTKQRLYLKMTDDGRKILAYCHHCNSKGYYKVRGTGAATVPSIKKKSTYIDIPDDAESDTTKWPAQARAWLWKYGLTPAEVNANYITYSPELRRVILPIATNPAFRYSYQARKIFDDDKGQKYITRMVENSRPFFWGLSHKSKFPKSVVVCEDILSAIKLSRYVDSVALLTTSMSDVVRDFLTKTYDDAIIFLDDDTSQVKMQQVKIRDALSLHMRHVVIYNSGGKDPKEHSDDELKNIIETIHKGIK